MLSLFHQQGTQGGNASGQSQVSGRAVGRGEPDIHQEITLHGVTVQADVWVIAVGLGVEHGERLEKPGEQNRGKRLHWWYRRMKKTPRGRREP